MDFTSQLANLQRTADAAASSREGRNNGGGGGPDRRRAAHPPDQRRHAPYDNRHRGRNRRGGSQRNRPYNHEGNMRHALSSIPPYCPPHIASSQESNGNRIPHVALLVISIDDLPFEEIWREWASPENQSNAGMHVSVLCHAKHPNSVTSSWLRQRLLVHPPVMGRGNEYDAPKYHTRCPEWGSIEITRAMLDLVQEGLRIGYNRELDPRFSTDRYALRQQPPSDDPVTPVDKFIFCSETCIPVTTLEETKAALFGKEQAAEKEETSESPELKEPMVSEWDVSWINARNTPNNGYSRQLQFDKVSRSVPHVWKADQWMALSRPHAAAILDIDGHLPRGESLWRCFVHCKASDEMFFPTALGLLRLLRSVDGETSSSLTGRQVKKRRITYADWSESAKNPASFTRGLVDLKTVATVARKEGCLFARKFSPSVAMPDHVEDKESEKTGMITAVEWSGFVRELTEKEEQDSLETGS